MKILITGNLGYVGPSVTRQLRLRHPEATLIGVDIGYFAHCLTDACRVPEILLDAQYYADLRRLPPGLLDGVDAVVHLAAISNDPMGNAFEDVTFDVNYRAGIELARQARAAGVRAFVFASSCSVYGSADDRARTEESEVAPLTAYARSKVLTEQGLRELAGPGFRVSCLRFATACGMSDRLRLDLVLNDFVAGAISTSRITVLSDGTPWRPLINVRDMARAIEWAIERPADAGGDCLIVNAGTNAWNYQVHELATAVADAIPGTEVSINRAAPPDKRSYRVDFGLFQSLAPAHQPLADLSGTIAALRAGLAAINFHDQDFRNSSLMRLRVLADLTARGLLSPNLEWTDKRAPGATIESGRADRLEAASPLP
ncbi:MAG: SDR family oxidoreductase [Acidobacteriota bacterium]